MYVYPIMAQGYSPEAQVPLQAYPVGVAPPVMAQPVIAQPIPMQTNMQSAPVYGAQPAAFQVGPPGAFQPSPVGPARNDPEPFFQWAFMWGWLLGFIGVPCVCCSTCAGSILNSLSPETFIKTRRDEESAAFVSKAAKFGCVTMSCATCLFIVFYVVSIAVVAGAESGSDPTDNMMASLGLSYGIMLGIVALCACANIANVFIGVQMHQNDQNVVRAQQSGEVPMGAPSRGLVAQGTQVRYAGP